MLSGKRSNQGVGSKYSVDYLPDVESDVLNAFDWYEAQQKGLGGAFLLSIEDAISRVERNPYSFQKIYKQIRRTLTKKFPFGIFFIVNEEKITVTAIVHQARHPKTWKGRS